MPGFFSEFIRRLNFKKPKLKFTPKTFLEFSTIFGIIYLFALTYEYDNLFSPIRNFHYKYILKLPPPPFKEVHHGKEKIVQNDMKEFHQEVKKFNERKVLESEASTSPSTSE